MVQQEGDAEAFDWSAKRDSRRSATARRPRRTRVVLADPRSSRRAVRMTVEIEEQTSVGEALVRNLVRAQLRAAVLKGLIALGMLCALPAAFYLSPAFANVEVLGIRLPWLLLGGVSFPFLWAMGASYNRTADRHERDFVNMVDS